MTVRAGHQLSTTATSAFDARESTARARIDLMRSHHCGWSRLDAAGHFRSEFWMLDHISIIRVLVSQGPDRVKAVSAGGTLHALTFFRCCVAVIRSTW